MVNKMMDFWRQVDIISPVDMDAAKVNIIGVGGIGSPTAMALSKMGIPEIEVYDNDVVDTHNLPNQFYRIKDIGNSKVESLKDICSDFSMGKFTANHEMYEDQDLDGIVVSGVDSMKARKAIWTNGVKYKPSINMYIDARMGAEICRIYTINPTSPDQIKFYESTLYDDEEASEERCTAKAIIYNTFMISSLICNQVKKFLKGEEIVKEIMFDMKNLMIL